MISAGEFRNGVTFDMDGKVMQVIEFQHVKPGKGAAFVRVKMKNVTKKEKKKLSTDEKIYRFLDVAEKVATLVANNQKAKKKKAKKQLKKDKKIGKIDKTTGALVLKKATKTKKQKPIKRFKQKKKKQ